MKLRHAALAAALLQAAHGFAPSAGAARLCHRRRFAPAARRATVDAATVETKTSPDFSTKYDSLVVGVPRESLAGEKRVAQTPESIKALTKKGITVNVESGAGAAAALSDAMYEEAGANIVAAEKAWAADIVVHINPPTEEEAARVGDRTLLSMVYVALLSLFPPPRPPQQRS